MKIKQSLLISLAYLAMILIWSTTPLAIKWSSQGVNFITGVTLRMMIGVILALFISLLWHRKLPLHKQALQVYCASAISIFGAMMMVYWGAQYIPSGLISVLFGLSPIMTAVIAVYWAKNESLTMNKIIGAVLGFMGLMVIFIEQINIGEEAIGGIIAVLFAALLHSASAVWIKHINEPLPALVVTSGGLLFSLPLFLLSYWIFADPLPDIFPEQTLYAIIYLGVMGSVVGFVSYYFVLAHLPASTVALATLMTPISALYLGNLLNHEQMSISIVIGTFLVMLGLCIHQFYSLLMK